jgi:folate-binding protein YgfZ
LTTPSYHEDPVLLAQYRALRAGAGLRGEASHARVWLGGEDRVAFLQRLTTNDVRLEPGQGTVTILTSPTARILAVFAVLAYPEGLLLVGGPDQGPALYDGLRSQVFFNDRVTVEGRGAALTQVGLYGPAVGQVLAAAGAGDLDSLPPFHWREVILGEAKVAVQRPEGLGNGGYTVLAPAEVGNALEAAVVAAGAVPVGEAAFEVARVEAGVPALGPGPGGELTERVNPLEAGLRRFCNDHKGCYTGQEIIARQITYDKVTTHLVGLVPEGPVAPEAAVQAGGRPVGWVSSAVHSIGLGQPIALAFVRRPYDAPGTEVAVMGGTEAVAAEVRGLPFV